MHEFKAGWRPLLGALTGIAGGFASLYFYSAGLFIKPLAAAFGWSRGEVSLGALAVLVGMVVALPVAGRLIDRYGGARVGTVSILGLAISFLLLAVSTNGLVSFLSLVLMLALVSSASNPVAFNRVIVAHFSQRRGLALGVALTGTGLGAVFLPALLTPFIALHGWRAGYLALAATALLLALAAALLLRGAERTPSREPAEPATGVYLNQHFLRTAALIFLTSTGVLGTVAHFVPMLLDRDISPSSAGMLASVLGLSVIACRIAIGQLLDIFDAGIVAGIALLLSACGMLLLATGKEELLLCGTILAGLGLGTEADLIAYLIARHFPLRSFSTAYGAVFSVHAVGGGIGPFAAGVIYDRTGDYRAWLVLSAVLIASAAAIALFTQRRSANQPGLDAITRTVVS